MNQVKVFKVLTYVLAVPTAFVAFFTFFGLLAAFMNPPMLIPIFILACVVVYVISSFIFLQKTIILQTQTKKRIKDLLKINGIITVIFSTICLIDFISMLTQPATIEAGISKAFAENPNVVPPQFTKQMMVKIVWVLLSFTGIYSILLLVHYAIGLKLRKQYDSLFLND
jgi:hypothetical protein